MIEMVRVDDRLLHGQVAFLWTKHLKIQTILIANDDILTDEFTMLSLNLAKPPGINLIVDSMDNAVKYIKNSVSTTERVLVVINNLKDAAYIFESVEDIRELNLGGLRERPGSKRLTNAISLTQSDMDYCKILIDKGIKIEMQSVPDLKKKTLLLKDISEGE